MTSDSFALAYQLIQELCLLLIYVYIHNIVSYNIEIFNKSITLIIYVLHVSDSACLNSLYVHFFHILINIRAQLYREVSCFKHMISHTHSIQTNTFYYKRYIACSQIKYIELQQIQETAL